MLSAKAYLLQLLDEEDHSELSRVYAPWLLSEITSPTWRMQFEKGVLQVNWKVKFGKNFLTDSQHASLLRTIQSWMLFQTHPVCCGSTPAQGQVAYNKITHVLRLADYMLLHDHEWQLSSHGFRAVTENDITNMLFAFECHSADEDMVYEWPRRLAEYLIEQGDALTEKAFAEAVKQQPMIETIELPVEEWTLRLSHDQLVRGRAYLWLNGLYKKEKRLGYEYSPSTAVIAEDVYRHTLWGKSKKSIHEELCLVRFESMLREYEGVPVQTSVGEGGSEGSVKVRRQTLLTLPMLAQFGCEVPTAAIAGALKSWTPDVESRRAPGRFRPAPFWQVMDTFRHSTEFAIAHGGHLVASYHNVVRAALSSDLTVAKFVLEHDVRDFLEPATLQLGCKVWSLKTAIALPLGYPQRGIVGTARANSSEYFRRLRQNEGVIDLCEVLCGAIQHNTGAISARRQSELRNLPASGALDETRRFMTFGNAKSGFDGLLVTETRPLPGLIADLIAILERLHDGMPGADISKNFLFSLPGERGSLVHHISGYNGALDTLCDYFETPLNDEMKRHYIRQHQLRKFFVITFFYGSSYANLDILRHYLGHSDAEYLWHYVTAEIPGEMLRSVEATFIVDALTGRETGSLPAPTIQVDKTARDALESWAFERFRTKVFKLIDADALENYVNVLLKKDITVKPIFFDSPLGKQYVMGVTTTSRGCE